MKKTILTMITLEIAVLLSVAFLLGCTSAPVTPPPSVSSPEPDAVRIATGPQAGKLAPDFSFKDSAGKSTSLSDLRGKSVMMNFWATWCAPCRAEMPLIEELWQSGRWQDLVLLTVNNGESAAAVRTFMQNQGYSFPVLLDGGNRISQAYQVRGIPTTFFIDRDGIIKNVKVGALNDAELDRLVTGITEK